MASGVPVISTLSGGIPEVIDHGKSGLLSEIGDIQEMSKNALHILSSSSTLQEFKSNAVERAGLYDIIKILPRYEDLYIRTLELSQ